MFVITSDDGSFNRDVACDVARLETARVHSCIHGTFILPCTSDCATLNILYLENIDTSIARYTDHLYRMPRDESRNITYDK